MSNKYRVNNRQVPQAVHNRERFHNGTGSLTGGSVTEVYPTKCRMDNDAFDELMKLVEKGEVFYIVYSYGTPIAVAYSNGRWEVFEKKYSVTTSKHQNLVRQGFETSPLAA